MLLMRHLFTEYTKVHSSQCYFVCLASWDLNKKAARRSKGYGVGTQGTIDMTIAGNVIGTEQCQF